MNKKLRNGILAGALLAVIATTGTLAYFSLQTETKTNVFTMGAGLTAELKEPTWDHDPFTDEETPTGDKGEDLAKNFYPDQIIPKDPAVKNTTKDAPAYIAIKLDYKKADAASSFSELDKFIDVTFDDANWTISEDKTMAYYKTTVAAGAKTTTLFDQVHIDKLAITQEQFDGKHYTESLYKDVSAENYIISNFEIIATGYAVQVDGFADAETAMKEAYPEVFK